jgi:hypothetical protein
MSREKLGADGTSTAHRNIWNRLAMSEKVVELVAILAVTLLVAIVMLIANRAERSLVIFTALLGSVIWGLAYQIVLYKSGMQSPGDNSRLSMATTRMETRLQSGNLARYGIATVGITFVVLAVGLLLDQFGFLDEAVIGIPLVAVFPFSYLAYVAFQRNVRIERLRRDFQLLDAKWDRTLFEHSQGMINFALHIILAMLVTVGGLAIFRYAAVDASNRLLT